MVARDMGIGSRWSGGVRRNGGRAIVVREVKEFWEKI